MISILVGGVSYTGFISYAVRRSVEDLSGFFDLSMSRSNDQPILFKVGDSIRILISGKSVLFGFIERMDIAYSGSTHTIHLSGRDKVADLVDSTVGVSMEFVAPVTLDRIIRSATSAIALTGVNVINEAGAVEPFVLGDMVSGQLDETIFHFLEKYTRKRQILMTTDGLGNVVLARTGSKQYSSALVHSDARKASKSNNILNASVKYDNSNRFNLYRVSSQGNPAGSLSSGEISNRNLVHSFGSTTDPDIRSSRVLDIIAESSSSNAVCKRRSEWEAVIRKARSMTYYCEVLGHTYNDSDPWEPNRNIPVIDEFAKINSILLIKSVTYSLSLESGTTTQLQLVSPESYTPEPKFIKSRGKSARIGKGTKNRDESIWD